MNKHFRNILSISALLFVTGLCCKGSITYTTVNVPGATSTLVLGISNSGAAVGVYYDSSGNTHGFEVLGNGTLVYPFDDPNGTDTSLRNINDSGTMTGAYGVGEGFVLSGNTYTTYSTGSGFYTMSLSINDQSDFAGTNVAAAGYTGFIVIGNASPIFVNVPGSFQTLITGINDLDYTWGTYLVASGIASIEYWFVRAPDGTITTFSTPVFGVNDNGTVNNVPSFTVPGSTSTTIIATNNGGDFVGYYTDTTGNHGFIADVPEASSTVLAGVGLLAIATLWTRRFKNS